MSIMFLVFANVQLFSELALFIFSFSFFLLSLEIKVHIKEMIIDY